MWGYVNEVAEKNSVQNIRNAIDKNTLTHELKLELKAMGPPRPVLNINQEVNSKKANKTYTRKFHMNLYNSETWLCGCDIRNALFCYVCLVINCPQGDDKCWMVRGVTDLKHLSEKIKRHRISERHMNNCVEYSMLGTVNIVTQLKSTYRASIEKHNENVKRNRNILSKIIDDIKFCGAFELALRARDESSDSYDPGIFRGLINLMSEAVDNTLKEHLEKSKDNASMFVDLSKTIQNEVLESIYAICLDLIHKEVQEADYIAIQADETTDCSTTSQVVFIVRYELKGCLHERFIGFLVPENHTADGISKVIFKELEKLKINQTPSKLIAQSYDGAPVMSGVQAKIKEVYPDAQYIHCYAHQLNSIIERIASQNKQVRIFFSNLEGFASFFSKSAKRTAILDEVVNERLSRSSATRWNFKSRCVTTVFTHKEDIITCLEKIMDDTTSDQKTIRKAYQLKNCLEDCDFNFWLFFFSKVMPNCDVLFNQLQHREIDATKVQNGIKTFKSAIQYIRNSVDGDFYKEETNDAEPPLSKRPRYDDTNKIVAKEVCDVIMTNIDDRFSFNDHLAIASLFEPKLFSKYQLLFPDSEVDSAAKTFKIDKNLLKHELKVIYNRSDFCNASGALLLLKCLYDNNLTSVFPESVKLLKIICTMPIITTESERCFSTLQRIKTFSRNIMKQDRLSALAICSIETKLVRETPNFNELVIDHFAKQNERKIDLRYKNIN